MTNPPEDQPALWLKLVPTSHPHAEGVWSQSLIPGHSAVQRSRERPTAHVDAVHLQDLKVAAQAVSVLCNDLHVPEFKRLHDALMNATGPGA